MLPVVTNGCPVGGETDALHYRAKHTPGPKVGGAKDEFRKGRIVADKAAASHGQGKPTDQEQLV